MAAVRDFHSKRTMYLVVQARPSVWSLAGAS